MASFEPINQKEDIYYTPPDSGSISNFNKSGVIKITPNLESEKLRIDQSFVEIGGIVSLVGGANSDTPGADIAATNTTLQNDFGADLFSAGRLKVGGNTDSINNDFGICSRLIKYTYETYANRFAGGTLTGWIPDSGDGTAVVTFPDADAIVAAAPTIIEFNDLVNKFNALRIYGNPLTLNKGYLNRKELYNSNQGRFKIRLYLKPYFAYCDYDGYTYGSPISLELVRDYSNERVFYGWSNLPGNLVTAAKIVINSVRWGIPYVTTVDPTLEEKLLKADTIDIYGLLRNVPTSRLIDSNNFVWNIDITNNYVKKIIIAFTDVEKPIAFDQNNALFTTYHKGNNANGSQDSYIENVQVKVAASQFYPLEEMQLAPIGRTTREYNWIDVYGLNIEASNAIGVHNQFTLKETRDLFPRFPIDLSAQGLKTDLAAKQIQVRIKKVGTRNFNAHAILFETDHKIFEVKNGKMTRLAPPSKD